MLTCNNGRTKVKSKQKVIHVIQLCGRKIGMLYITVVKSRTPLTIRVDLTFLIFM